MLVPMAGYAAKPLIPTPFSLTSAFRNLSVTPKRTFTSTPTAQKTAKLPSHIPPYPYGPNRIFKQADSGLYGGAVKQFGNKISKGRNKGRTRRSWSPNVRHEKLYSEALGKELEIKVRHRVLRTIRKVGGLDQYLLGDKPARIKELGIFGWKLRWRILQTYKLRTRFAKERSALGLPKAPITLEEFIEQKEEELERWEEEQENVGKQEESVKERRQQP
ncbi:39S ribosomal protein L24, mitochondrial [Arachnomyces sp. PD_36]|nr:39S ribosomal protein L24, mitochondrial [Arachnomyces sp. PD_36]